MASNNWTEVKTSQPKRVYKTNMKEFEEAIGAKTVGMIQIPYEEVDKLLKKGEVGVDAITLYTFLQWKGIKDDGRFGVNNRPWASREYCKKGLHWGTTRFVAANKLLKEEGLKIRRTHKDDKTGKFIKKEFSELPFINLTKKSASSPFVLENRQTVSGTPSTDITNNISTDPISVEPKKEPTTAFYVKSEKVQQAVSPHLRTNGRSAKKLGQSETNSHKKPIVWEDFKKDLCQPITTKESSSVYEDLKGQVPMHIIMNRQDAFNLHLKALIANLDLEHIPTSRIGYLAYFTKYVSHGQEMGANQVHRNIESRQSTRYAWEEGDYE